MPKYRVSCVISDVVEAKDETEAFDKSFEGKSLSSYPMDDFTVDELDDNGDEVSQ